MKSIAAPHTADGVLLDMHPWTLESNAMIGVAGRSRLRPLSATSRCRAI
jgi:hypothetical protein